MKLPIKIGIMGASIDSNNRGVSALATSLVKIIKLINPNADIGFFIGSKKKYTQKVKLHKNILSIKVYNYRLAPNAKTSENLILIFAIACLQKIVPIKSFRSEIIKRNSFLNALNNVDIVGNINGGDSFSDIYGFYKFIILTIPTIIALLLNKRVVLLPQTYGPFNGKLAKKISEKIISKSFIILSRDKQSISFIKDNFLHNINSKESILFCPDVAFMLDSIEPKKIVYNSKIINDKIIMVGVNVNGLMYRGGYTRKNMFGLRVDYKKILLKIIDTILQMEQKARIILIPHTYGKEGNLNSDPSACLELMKNLPDKYRNKVHLVKGEYSASEIKWIIGQCQFFIGSRMHSCIASLSQGIATVGIAYSKKFLGVFDSIGIGETVADARLIKEDEIIDKVVKIFRMRQKISQKISIKIETAQIKIIDTLGEFITK